jgi:phosphate transport system substrate-binding protein
VGLLAVAAGCGGSAPLDGRVRIAGSTTLLPMVSAVSAQFAADAPTVELDVRMTGSSDGAVLFCDGLVPLAGSSRPLNERELASCEASGVRFVRLLVARDAVALVVGPDVPASIACLTQEQIYALMGPESAAVATWRGASAVIVGSGSELPDTALTVIGPSSGSGTRQSLIDLAIAPLAKERGASSTLRPDYLAEPAEQLIRSSAASRPGSLAFAGLATVKSWADGLRLLEVDFGEGCQPPTAAAIDAGAYPLSRELYVYVNLAAVAATPTEDAFVDALVSSAGLATAGAVGGVPLTEQEGDEVRAHWQSARSTGKGDTA